MNNLIAPRDVFWDTVYEQARKNTDIVVVSADMGAKSLDKIRKNIPSQFVNTGIAEQNTIVVAAGLAVSGKKVFVYAIAPFITLRCLEQIRVKCSIMKIPITIVGVGKGFSYSDSGPTHHLTEDISIMRSMPDITINNITDNAMAEAFANISCSMKTANYIRLDKDRSPDIYDKNTNFNDGLSVLKENVDGKYIITTGIMVPPVLEIAEKLGIGVIDVYTFPINEKLFLKTIGNAKKLVSVEEHFIVGGLGSSICEIIVDNNLSIPLKRMGLTMDKGYCYEYGGRDIIHKYYGIDKNNLEKQIVEHMKK